MTDSVFFGWGFNILIILNIMLAVVVIFIERRDASATWAWLLVLFFLPVIGFIIYLFFGRQLKKDNFYNLSRDEQSYFSNQVEAQLDKVHSQADPMDSEALESYHHLMAMNLKGSSALVSINNRVQVLHDGTKKFEELLEDIKLAQKEINIQYYIIQRDALGARLLKELVEKAKEGVKVRILYDAVGSRKLRESDFKGLIAHNGEVRVFFPPLFGLINLRINNRNHRKVVVIDGKVAYLGGFNVGKEYLGLIEKFGYWRDTHLRIQGDAVYHIQDRFIFDWNFAKEDKDEEEETFVFEKHDVTEEAPMQIVTSGPNSDTEHVKNMIIKMIMSARRSVYIQTPYFIPDKSFMDACKMALLSGVKMKIMIPGKPDHPFVMWASWAALGELLPYGADVFQYEGGFLHAKMITVDGDVATVGTANIDARSFRLNFEINALIFERKLASNLETLFEEDIERCRQLTLEDYENRGILVKVREGVSSLLSPIL